MNHIFKDPAAITNSKYLSPGGNKHPADTALDRKAY